MCDFFKFFKTDTINDIFSRFLTYKPLKLPMHKTSTLVSTILKTTKNKQQKVTLVDEIEPSDSLIQNILNYSMSLTIKKSDSVGFIEIMAS